MARREDKTNPLSHASSAIAKAASQLAVLSWRGALPMEDPTYGMSVHKSMPRAGMETVSHTEHGMRFPIQLTVAVLLSLLLVVSVPSAAIHSFHILFLLLFFSTSFLPCRLRANFFLFVSGPALARV